MKALYLHQFSGIPQQTVAELGEALRAAGVTHLHVKAFDADSAVGPRWMGAFDPGGASRINGPDDLATLKAALAPYGIALSCWAVVRGRPEWRDEHVAMAKAVADVTGQIDFDIEPEAPLFWGALRGRDFSEVRPFFAAVRAALGSAEILVDFPGSWAWGYLEPDLFRLAEPYVDGWLIQSYFGSAVAAADEERLRRCSTRPVYHIADTPHLDETAAWLAGRGAGRLYVWQASELGARGLQSLARYAFGGTAMTASADVTELSQFDPGNFDTRQEYLDMDGAACSAASLAAVLNHYGLAANISDGLRRIRATGEEVSSHLGLLNRLGQGEGLASALDAAGIAASTHQWADLTRVEFRAVLESGRPIICQMHNYLSRALGHFLVVDGLLADGSGVTVADSNAGRGKRFSYPWPAFWAEMAGGVAVWPDAAPTVAARPSGVNAEGEDMARIAELEEQVADLKAKHDALIVAVAYLADTLADKVTALAGVTIVPEQAQAVANEAQRVREQFVGPRPPQG